MANDITGRMWELDTAGVIYTDNITIRMITWDPDAAARTLTIIDNNGNKIIPTTTSIAASPAGRETFNFNEPIVRQGFNLSVLGGGTLNVLIGPK